MSCIMMNSKNLASLADWIEAELNMGLDFFGLEAPDELRKALDSCADNWGFFIGEKIYKRLYLCNLAAYYARYGKHTQYWEPIPPYSPNRFYRRTEWKNQHRMVDKWHYQAAKHLDFLLYQCSNGDVPKSLLYQGLKKLSERLNSFIVQNSEEWQALPWE